MLYSLLIPNAALCQRCSLPVLLMPALLFAKALDSQCCSLTVLLLIPSAASCQCCSLPVLLIPALLIDIAAHSSAANWHCCSLPALIVASAAHCQPCSLPVLLLIPSTARCHCCCCSWFPGLLLARALDSQCCSLTALRVPVLLVIPCAVDVVFSNNAYQGWRRSPDKIELRKTV